MATEIVVMEPTYPVRVRVAVGDSKPCDHCGGIACVVLLVSPTGYSVGDEHEHDPICVTLFCNHGVPFKDSCTSCDAEEERKRNDTPAMRSLCEDVATALDHLGATGLAKTFRDLAFGGEAPGGSASECREELKKLTVDVVDRFPVALRDRILAACSVLTTGAST